MESTFFWLYFIFFGNTGQHYSLGLLDEQIWFSSTDNKHDLHSGSKCFLVQGVGERRGARSSPKEKRTTLLSEQPKGFGFNSLMAGRSVSPDQSFMIFITANQNLLSFELIVGRRENNSRLTYKGTCITTKLSSIHNLTKSSEYLLQQRGFHAFQVIAQCAEAGVC